MHESLQTVVQYPAYITAWSSFIFLRPGSLFLLLLPCCASKIDMASTVEQLLNPETLLATPVAVLQPFAAKESYFVPKSVTSPVW